MVIFLTFVPQYVQETPDRVVYGLKVHLVINDRGEIPACQITPGNVGEVQPVSALCKWLFGKLIADRNNISQPLFEQLLATFKMQLITRIKKNMKKLLDPNDR